MLTPIVVLYLFALGVLVLFGLWRIERAATRATLQRGLLARRVARLSRRVLLLNRSMRALPTGGGGLRSGDRPSAYSTSQSVDAS